MNTASKIRATRLLLITAILTGLVLGLVGLFIGLGVPGLIISTAGWAIVIAGVVWLVSSLNQRSTAESRSASWRPGDGDAPQ